LEGILNRIAIAVWKDRVSPVFDVSRDILVLDIENGSVTHRCLEKFTYNNPEHMLLRLMELKVKHLICGAISRTLAELLSGYGIKMISFTSGKIEEIIDAYLAGRLPNPVLAMPGCSGWRKTKG
jgi:predicted Fe-Mo cluster-binding NifX family protein